jgi:hypothetical protein
MKVSLKTVTKLSLASLANLAAIASQQALAETSDIVPSEELVSSDRLLDIEAQRLLVDLLVKRLKTDANFRAEYLTDPRQAMTGMGLHPEVQREILIEEGLIDAEDAILEGDCTCTGCCVTSITVG